MPNLAIMTFTEQLTEVSKWCLLMLVALAIFDVLFARKFQGRYFILHVIANSAITYHCIPEFLDFLTDPVAAVVSREGSLVPLGFVFAIHFYHMMPFLGFKLYYVDWLHHILMVVIACPLLMFTGSGKTMNFTFLFICGIPGGLDYLMLVLVKEKVMKPLTEKRYNNILQIWMRAPFINISVWLLIMQTFEHRKDEYGLNTFQILCRVFCGGITYWNCNYFMERVCGNYYVTARKLRDTMKENKGKEKKDRVEIESYANPEDLRKKVLDDDVDQHPIPDSMQVPGHARNVRFGALSKVWEFIRVGS